MVGGGGGAEWPTKKINGSRGKTEEKRGKGKNQTKERRSPEKFPSFWVENLFFGERGGGE